MIRQTKPVVYASVLGLAAIHCGGGSTPESTTPAQASPQQSSATAAEGSSAQGGTDPSMAPSGTAPAEEWSAGGERMPTAGMDEPGAAGQFGSAATEAGMTLSDGQIAAVTELVHNSEMEQARLAQTRSQNPQVQNYAAMMLNHHGQARQKESALGLSTTSSPLLQQLSVQGQQALATLRDKSGSDFDRAYIQTQIEQHQRALDLIDRQLLPNVDNPQLRTHLQTMRPTIQQHLKAARDAQMALNAGGQGPADSSPGQMPPGGTQGSPPMGGTQPRRSPGSSPGGMSPGGSSPGGASPGNTVPR